MHQSILYDVIKVFLEIARKSEFTIVTIQLCLFVQDLSERAQNVHQILCLGGHKWVTDHSEQEEELLFLKQLSVELTWHVIEQLDNILDLFANH